MQSLRTHLSSQIEGWIVRVLPFIIRRSLRRDLHAVWVRGDWDKLPAGGVILAINHHSWWDAYLCWLIRERLRPASGMMQAAQLKRFRFFRHFGVLSERELREALRRLERGHLFFIFPEGEMRAAGEVERIERGIHFLASRSGAPIYPLAFRVVMRGAQYPEAFIALGERFEGQEAALVEAMNANLRALEETIAASHPEQPPQGFVTWLKGASSTHERMAWVRRLWF